MAFPKIGVPFLGAPYNQDHSVLGSLLVDSTGREPGTIALMESPHEIFPYSLLTLSP